jgi:putative ABC transport system permease protein
MILYIRLINESFKFAWNSLVNNKLRTFLSLLGVTVGIFSIIAVLTAVDSLEKQIKDDLNSLDKNMIYLVNFSFGPTDIPQWKWEAFPKVSHDEYEFIKRSISGIDKMSFNLFLTKSENIKFEEKEVKSVNIVPTTNDLEYIENLKIEYGRFMTESESNSGSQVIVIGHDLAQGLFKNNQEAIGKKVRIFGKRFNIIGVLRKEGMSTFGENKDAKAYVSSNFIRKIYGENNDLIIPAIVIKPVKSIDMVAFQDEIKAKFRKYRSLKDGEIDNFFINVFSGFTDMIDGLIGQLNLAGWVIALFSLLVGGFGIANIMFVSVKERTNLIGIQKSLGAKNKFILFQFLFEAVILAFLGGVIGIFLVWICSLIVTNLLDFEFIMSLKNILIGSGLSAVIGLLSGLIPAIFASKLDPVEAIRTGI